jgi:cell division protein FtsX
VEKILEVRDQRSIVKTFFVTAGIQNIGIGIAILVSFFSILTFSQNENPNGEPKDLHFSLI